MIFPRVTPISGKPAVHINAAKIMSMQRITMADKETEETHILMDGSNVLKVEETPEVIMLMIDYEESRVK